MSPISLTSTPELDTRSTLRARMDRIDASQHSSSLRTVPSRDTTSSTSTTSIPITPRLSGSHMSSYPVPAEESEDELPPWMAAHHQRSAAMTAIRAKKRRASLAKDKYGLFVSPRGLTTSLLGASDSDIAQKSDGEAGLDSDDGVFFMEDDFMCQQEDELTPVEAGEDVAPTKSLFGLRISKDELAPPILSLSAAVADGGSVSDSESAPDPQHLRALLDLRGVDEEFRTYSSRTELQRVPNRARAEEALTQFLPVPQPTPCTPFKRRSADPRLSQDVMATSWRSLLEDINLASFCPPPSPPNRGTSLSPTAPKRPSHSPRTKSEILVRGHDHVSQPPEGQKGKNAALDLFNTKYFSSITVLSTARALSASTSSAQISSDLLLIADETNGLRWDP
ncbi:hypothetical protein BT69DRAFT_980192 [Atractiella rhizophila]|nr:hypothetical protein BT69DRAFT_980192 [Atractiella rhizophila]